MANKDWCSLSPDSIFGVDISVACKKHDYAYYDLYKKVNNPKNQAKRKEADRLLKERIIELGAPRWIACIYYFMVRLFGGWGLWKS